MDEQYDNMSELYVQRSKRFINRLSGKKTPDDKLREQREKKKLRDEKKKEIVNTNRAKHRLMVLKDHISSMQKIIMLILLVHGVQLVMQVKRPI
jgi:hypothetical protein